ncbi:MAG: hypothetical protein U0V49_09195 [Saprospiraceae bacterium]
MRICFLLICGLVFFLGCKKEAYLTRHDLQGKWILTKAFRGEKTTVTLNGAFYMFQDTMLTTNIFGDNLSTGFHIDHQDVVHMVPFEMRYTVTKNQDSTLTFATNIDGIPFRFVLKRE